MDLQHTRAPLVSLAMASAAALAYQLQLVRLFSIIQWHHFAYMIISLALLGYGASGTVLSLVQRRIKTRLRGAYVLTIAMFAATAVPAFLLAQSLAFSPEELLWRPSMVWRLACLYLVLGTPFFLVACAVGLAFMGWGSRSNRVYAADLAGAAAGGLLAIGMAWWIVPGAGPGVAGMLGAAAAVVASLETGRGRGLAMLLAVAYASVMLMMPEPELRLSAYKDLSHALQVAGAEVKSVRSSPWGLITVVANDVVPFRDAPGIGLKVTAEPPVQLAIFRDGDFLSTITRDAGDPADLRFLGSLPSAAPFAVSRPPRVLVLGAGGGMLALQARYLGAGQVTAVERNPDIVDLVRGEFAGFSGRLYDGEAVTVVRAHPRAFLQEDERTWDLIQLPAAGGLGGGASGLFALNEDYLRTKEAIGAMLDRLAPGGMLSVQAWETLPPRASLRLAATLVDAMRRRGIDSPGDHIVALRSWQLAVIMVRNGRFDAADLAALRTFASERGYDLAWYPGMSPNAPVRDQNRTAKPWLRDAVASFVSGDGEFARRYKFDVGPTSDDRPFFNNFLRWRTVPEALGLVHSGGMPLLEAGYILLLVTLLQAGLLAAVLILLPIACRRSVAARSSSRARDGAGRTALYFGCIGLAFMLVEVAAIHRFILFLEEPVIAAAVVVSAFLAFAGLGGFLEGMVSARIGARRAASAGAAGAAVFGSGWLLLVGPVIEAGVGGGIGARIALVLAVIAPLALAMGLPFPSAMGALSESAPAQVPWAWAVNGCASVTGAVLATVLSMSVGFQGCMLLALVLYLGTLGCFPVPAREAGGSR